jgi:uncharacterized protein (TIGR02598 family)
MKLPAKSQNQAFSLIEVVIALGIFSFALLSIMGLMAEGMNSSRNSSTNQAMANISRNLRANLQATPFTNWISGTPAYYYFTYGGYPTTATSTGDNAPFYTAALIPGAPAYPGNGTSPTTSQNAYTIVATVSYPYPGNALAVTNSYFIAQ